MTTISGEGDRGGWFLSGEGAVRVDSDERCTLGGGRVIPVDVLGCGEGGRGVRALLAGRGACFLGRGGGGATPICAEGIALAEADATALVSMAINGTICGLGGDEAERLWGDGVTWRLTVTVLVTWGGEGAAWRDGPRGERSLAVTGGEERPLSGTGGAERLLASSGRAGGVSGVRSSRRSLGWLDAVARLLRGPDGREDPCGGAEGTCCSLLDTRHDRRGEVSGEESSISMVMGSGNLDILVVRGTGDKMQVC